MSQITETLIKTAIHYNRLTKKKADKNNLVLKITFWVSDNLKFCCMLNAFL